MFSHDQIGPINPCQENTCLLDSVCRCIDLNTTYYRCISCSFPNNLTNVIIYPKTRFLLEGWDRAYLALVYPCFYYYFNAWHSLLRCSFMQPLWRKCCSSDLPWYLKIAKPTALCASSLRPGNCRSVAQLLYRSVR